MVYTKSDSQRIVLSTKYKPYNFAVANDSRILLSIHLHHAIKRSDV